MINSYDAPITYGELVERLKKYLGASIPPRRDDSHFICNYVSNTNFSKLVQRRLLDAKTVEGYFIHLKYPRAEYLNVLTMNKFRRAWVKTLIIEFSKFSQEQFFDPNNDKYMLKGEYHPDTDTFTIRWKEFIK